MASSIPSELIELSQPFAKASLIHCQNVNANEKVNACTPPAFVPSAAIVNYYHDKSVMGPHRDDSEHAVSKPIVSFSMGRPALFLLGGDTKHDPVVPMLVRPGDVMIMGGASRLNYHCMARLLPARAGSLKKEDDIHNNDLKKHQIATIHNMPVPSGSERAALEQYLTKHRININLRQVYDD
ncbi:hypothetical protein MPSEU_000865800 [Mayamaea pseudoterrestris]|nr:hypothetical protein MPSEU_000865800 [Mayamaea pseudoterrestris]